MPLQYSFSSFGSQSAFLLYCCSVPQIFFQNDPISSLLGGFIISMSLSALNFRYTAFNWIHQKLPVNYLPFPHNFLLLSFSVLLQVFLSGLFVLCYSFLLMFSCTIFSVSVQYYVDASCMLLSLYISKSNPQMLVCSAMN